MNRLRNCSSCGDALGGTIDKCYECGGEKPSPSREERLADAYTWKILLGVERSLIEEAHDDE